MKKDDTLHIIVIDDSSNDAETVSNMIRNAGHAVRAERAEDDEDLREALSKSEWDMILTKPKLPFLNAADAVSIVENLNKDVPIIVLADGADEDTITQLFKSGVRDAVNIEQPARLVHAVLREYAGKISRDQHARCNKMLEEADARAQALVDNSRDAIAYVHDGMHIYSNEAYLQMFGYSDMAEIEGMPIMNMIDGEDQSRFKTFLRDYSKGKSKESDIEIQGLKADGKKFKITMEFTPATYESEPCTQIVIRDQSISKELEQKLDSMSKKDLLTGLYNRQYFLDNLKSVVGKKGKEGAVLFVELDNYKTIRDEMGIGTADTVLAEVAGELNKYFTQEHEMVARFESQIFGAIIGGASAEKAEARAKELVAKINDLALVIEGQTVGTSCSVGIGLYSEGVPTPQDVITRGEKALSEAIEASDGTVKVYNPGAEEMAESEMAAVWAKRIRSALKQNSFKLLFQPIVSLQGETSQHWEVVVRMLGEEGEDIEPSEFFPAAEKAGLNLAIDRWVIAHAAKKLIEHRRAGHKALFFVKLSGATIKDAKFLPWLRDLLKALKMPAGSLVIEVSERVATNNLKALKILLDGLNQLHVKLALDHFGMAANYENLLKHFEAHYLKLDGELISGLTNNEEAQQKINQITTSAREDGKKTIANHIEDPATMASIYSTNIDFIQGYFIQPPEDNLDFDFDSMG